VKEARCNPRLTSKGFCSVFCSEPCPVISGGGVAKVRSSGLEFHRLEPDDSGMICSRSQDKGVLMLCDVFGFLG